MARVVLRNGEHYTYNFKYDGDHMDETWDVHGPIQRWLADHCITYWQRLIEVVVKDDHGNPYLQDNGNYFTAPDLTLEFERPQDAMLFKLTWM